MAWVDRLQNGKYTPKKGKAVEFEFEEVSKSFTLRGTAFEFPDAAGTYIQRTGKSGRRYPLRVIFSGADHDLAAKAFEDALRVEGIGELQHPFYGTFPAIPYGDVSRRDDLVNEANQSIIEATFYETLESAYPTISDENDIPCLLDTLSDFASDQFDKLANLADEDTQEAFKEKYKEYKNKFTDKLDGLTDKYKSAKGAFDKYKKQFDDAKKDVYKTQECTSNLKDKFLDKKNKYKDKYDGVKESIDNSLDYLKKDPKTLAKQTDILVRTPAKSGGETQKTRDTYKDLLNDIFGKKKTPKSLLATALENADTNTDSLETITERNIFHLESFLATSLLSGLIDCFLVADFTTRSEALEAATTLTDLHESLTQWQDDYFKESSQVNDGAADQAMLTVVLLMTGHLIDRSFSLMQERAFILPEDRTPIDLCAELYGTVDSKLDFFCTSNNFSWNEQLEILAGRKIVYYV